MKLKAQAVQKCQAVPHPCIFCWSLYGSALKNSRDWHPKEFAGEERILPCTFCAKFPIWRQRWDINSSAHENISEAWEADNAGEIEAPTQNQTEQGICHAVPHTQVDVVRLFVFGDMCRASNLTPSTSKQTSCSWSRTKRFRKHKVRAESCCESINSAKKLEHV